MKENFEGLSLDQKMVICGHVFGALSVMLITIAGILRDRDEVSIRRFPKSSDGSFTAEANWQD